MSRLTGWLFAGRMYAALLFGSGRPTLAHVPAPGESGDLANGRRIVGGVLVCANHRFTAPRPDWFDPAADAESLARLHDFHYLSDLAAAGDSARDCARALVASWIASGSDRYDVSWAPEILGARIVQWLTHARFLLFSTDDAFGREALASLSQQVATLARTVVQGRNGIARLIALKGLIYGAACGLGATFVLSRALALLRHELSRQILPDGCHSERSPTAQHRALDVLLDIRSVLDTAGITVPDELAAAIARLAPMLRFFRHGDGALALFNGSACGSSQDIDLLLTRSGNKEPAPHAAPQGGFQRVSAGTTLVLQDVGTPSPPGFDTEAHAGCLSLEMSDGSDRLIVNCGASDGAMRNALRTTAAHSTVVVADVNSMELRPDGSVGRRPTRVECSRNDMDGSVWVTASHNGYVDRFGLEHRRRVYLSGIGDNLRGEDALVSAQGAQAAPHPYAVRFHLHPDIQASLLQSGAAVLLRLPSGKGWRFHCDGVPRLEESVYFGDGAGRRTQQIVIRGSSDQRAAVVKWAFQRISGG